MKYDVHIMDLEGELIATQRFTSLEQAEEYCESYNNNNVLMAEVEGSMVGEWV